jgi:hypothetical protein
MMRPSGKVVVIVFVFGLLIGLGLLTGFGLWVGYLLTHKRGESVDCWMSHLLGHACIEEVYHATPSAARRVEMTEAASQIECG